MTEKLSSTARTILAGAVCLAILSGVLVVHAWPLWTGQSVLLPVTPVDPRDIFRGEYVRLGTPATRIVVRPAAPPQSGVLAVAAGDSWWDDVSARGALIVGRTIYAQLETLGESGESRPVSVSGAPLPGRMNLRGRVTHHQTDSGVLTIDYGLDSYFMQEGTAKTVEDAMRERKPVQMEIAVAASGHARIRRLLIDGRRVGR
jgi:uncharacterized membrane-anchored protein